MASPQGNYTLDIKSSEMLAKSLFEAAKSVTAPHSETCDVVDKDIDDGMLGNKTEKEIPKSKHCQVEIFDKLVLNKKVKYR